MESGGLVGSVVRGLRGRICDGWRMLVFDVLGERGLMGGRRIATPVAGRYSCLRILLVHGYLLRPAGEAR